MPAARKWLSRKFIQDFLDCSKSQALNIMHIFENRGQLIRTGKSLYVRSDHFYAWCDEKEREAALSRVV